LGNFSVDYLLIANEWVVSNKDC